MTAECEACHQEQPTQPREPLAESNAKSPMDTLGVDLFSFGGETYVATADKFSGYTWCQKLKRLDTQAVIRHLTEIFDLFGLPGAIRSDNGPQFRSEFDAFCRDKGIKHETSSPYYPRSNGLAEAAVKTTKHLLATTKEAGESFVDALVAFRMTPRADGVSPAQLFLGRRPRGHLPTLGQTPANNAEDAHLGRDLKTKQNKASYDQYTCLLYTSPSPRDATLSRMPSSA